MRQRTVLVAVGGNALIREGQRGTIPEQAENARATARPIASLIADGWRVVVTHGNGPQVGFILLRSELAGDAPVPALPLDMCGADSQGGIGHLLGSALLGELADLGFRDRVACLLTHTLVAANDPAFRTPSKPIGPWFTAEQAASKQTQNRWTMIEDAGRGYRRVVPSPRPLRIVEAPQIHALLDDGYAVIAAGGGGIPVVERRPGVYEGVEAVIDKDLASALLGVVLGIPLLIMSTGVEKVAVGFRRPGQRLLDRLTVSEARGFLDAGEFPPGSMGPKIEAAIEFLEQGGAEVLITSPYRLPEAVAGRTGTRVVPDRAA